MQVSLEKLIQWTHLALTAPFRRARQFMRRRGQAHSAAVLTEDAFENPTPLAAKRERPAKPARTKLVKARPVSLAERYSLIADDATSRELGDEMFHRLQRQIFAAAHARRDSGAAMIFTEAGRLAPGRPYFYVKPQSHPGWLFERSGPGWLVTQAEKIVARDLFMRGTEPLDSVMLYLAKDRVSFPRVKTTNLGAATRGPGALGQDKNDLLAFAVYEGRLLSQLGLA